MSNAEVMANGRMLNKEARETRYWLRLMVHADRSLQKAAIPLIAEARELIDILTTMKMNSERSFVIRHSSFVIRHSAFGIRHSAFGIRHSAFGIRHSAFAIRH